MKTKIYYLVLAVAIVILCIPLLAEIRPSLSEDWQPILIGRANPELGGMDILRVIILPSTSKPSKDGLLWKELQTKAELKLKKAGIKITHALDDRYASRSLHVPELKIYIDILKLERSRQYAFLIQPTLSRMVYLALRDKGIEHFKPKYILKADVWKVKPVMQTVSVQNMPAKVTEVVLEQIDAFIQAYHAANPPDTRSSDTNEVSIKPGKDIKPDARQIKVEYKYVASKNSKVFHSAECSWVKRISAKNIVSYDSRDEAIQAGKRPCKRCKP